MPSRVDLSLVIWAWTSPFLVRISAQALAISWSAPGRNTRAQSWLRVTASWSIATLACGALAMRVDGSADLRTGMYPVAAANFSVFSGEVRNLMKVAAATWFSGLIFFGIPTPAPPVGHTGEVDFGPPGRKPAPTLNLATLRMPTRLPVEPTVALTAPADRSWVESLPATPAHLPLYTESARNCSPATDSGLSQVMSKVSLADQPPPLPHRMFWKLQPAYPASAGCWNGFC